MSELICPECGSDRLDTITKIGPSGTIYDFKECQKCGYLSRPVVVKPYHETRNLWKEKYGEPERD